MSFTHSVPQLNGETSDPLFPDDITLGVGILGTLAARKTAIYYETRLSLRVHLLDVFKGNSYKYFCNCNLHAP